MSYSKMIGVRFSLFALVVAGVGAGIQSIDAAPTGLAAKAVSASQISLSWSDTVAETGFRIERAPSSAGPWVQIAQVAGTIKSYTDANLAASTAYTYRVKGFTLTAETAYSNLATATTLAGAGATLPATPTGLGVVATATNQILVSWTANSTNATSFYLERAPTNSGPWAQIVSVAGSTTSYLDSSLIASTYYAYRVRAWNAAGYSGYSNTNGTRTLAASVPVLPTAPTSLTVSALSSSQIRLQWTDNANNESGFKVERAASTSGPWSQIVTVGANVVVYTNSSLSASTLYAYRVRAYNSSGDSAYSNVGSASTLAAPVTIPVAPSALSATAASSSQINLAWTDNSNNETGFKVERATSSSGPWTQIVTTSAGVTSYASTGLAASTVYYFRVRATNSAGDSTYSNTATTSTQAASAPSPTSPGFTIPTTHPRLWWNAARLTQARQWYATHPFTPGSGDPFGCAFRYTMTGESTYARTAIDWLVNYTIPQSQLDGTASDNARWDGENAIVVYDWCYAQMTAAERTTVINRWNGYLDTLRRKTWGGVGMEMNNYYWGYLRNELEWGVATYGENSMAQSFLDTALLTRWQNSFLPFATGNGKGGVLQEGPGYGAVTAWYPVIPFATASFSGRNIWSETQFFKEMVFYIIYGTTPSPTTRKGDSAVTYELFPFNDSEYPQNGSIFASRKYYGDAMNVLANQWSGIAVGQYARRWLNRVAPSVSSHVTALDAGGTDRDFATLPLDFYGSGAKYLFARNNWGTGSATSPTTALHLTLGRPKGVGHSHRDAGSFQLWRNGGWLSRNTSGYAVSIIGFNGGNVDVSQPEANNVVLINGIGQLPDSWAKGDASVLRLEVKPAYVYVAVDLTQLYRANADFAGRVPEAPINSYVREFVFVRASETLYVCDRIDAGTGSVSATFLQHSEQATPAFTTTALIGTPTATRTVNEGTSVSAQTRFESDYAVTGKNYFVRRTSPAGVTDGNSVVFNSTLGGTFNGVSFSTGVQTMTVTDNGPAWQ